MTELGGQEPTGGPRPREASHLLIDLFRGSLDPGYADAARRRADHGPRLGWVATGSLAARLVVLVATGILLAMAYQRVVAVEPATSRARADLLADVRDRQAAAEDLQRRADRLRDEVARQGDAALESAGAAAALRAQAAGAGLRKVIGHGVVVRLADAPPPVDPVTGKPSADNPGVVLDRDLQEIANALWLAGAEAIAINDQRLTATATIRAAGGAILVDFQPVTGPYNVIAIGPGDLDKRFEGSATARRFHGYVDGYRMKFSVRARDDLTLPAGPEPRLRFARPLEPATPAGPSPSGSVSSGGEAPRTPSPSS